MTPKNVALLLAEAKSWVGTPWHHAAALKGVGVDCAMLLVRCYQSIGVLPEDFDPRPYPRDWHLHRSEERFMDAVLERAKATKTPKPGDLALYKFGRCYSHGAIVVEWPIVIHSYVTRGTVYDHGDQGDLADRSVKFYRIKAS